MNTDWKSGDPVVGCGSLRDGTSQGEVNISCKRSVGIRKAWKTLNQCCDSDPSLRSGQGKSNKHLFVFDFARTFSVTWAIGFEEAQSGVECRNDSADASHGREDFILQ